MKLFAVFKSLTIVCVLLLCCNITISQANIYYVDQNHSSANDTNPGTVALPWLTIQHAAETLVTGDTVYIRTGIYSERLVPKNSGQAGNYITYASYPGEVATIDGASVPLPADWGGLFDVTQKSYIAISGLKIINAGPNDNNPGILVDNSSHIIIEKNHIYNTVSSGIGVWNSDNVIIDSNEVELACNDGEQECITVATTTFFEISNNHVYHGGPGSMGGEGIDAKDGSSNGKIYGNHVHDIPHKLGIYVDAWDKHTHSIKVFRNTVHKCGGDGITLASEQGGLLENINVYNNIIYDNKNVGISITPNGDAPNPPMKNILIINNTIFSNGWNAGAETWGGGIAVDNPNAANIIIRNNISSQNLNFQIAIESSVQNISVDFNLIDGFRGELDEEIYGSGHVEGDPLFVNTLMADFHLQENSPAIDAGSAINAPDNDFNGISRPQGNGIDIGAFEFANTEYVAVSSIKTIRNYRLFQNYPNPFSSEGGSLSAGWQAGAFGGNPQTTIEYDLPRQCQVSVVIFNSVGQRIRLVKSHIQGPGRAAVTWDGRDELGEIVASGVYLYRIVASALENKNENAEILFQQTKKMLLVK